MAKSLRRLRHTWALVLALAIGGCAHQEPAGHPAEASLANRPVRSEDFIVVYPGVYSAREADPVRQYLAGNAALKKRGPVDVHAPVSGHRPIHQGDTLYLVANERTVIDITPPEGSVYRSIVIQTRGSAYNQRGEKVNDVVFRVTESVKQYKDGLAPANSTFADFWEAPE
jgi:hypothetical protein